MKPNLSSRIHALVLGCCLAGVAALADEPPADTTADPTVDTLVDSPPSTTTTTKKEKKESLAQAAEDPTAALLSLYVSSLETPRFYGLGAESANTTTLRLGVPFKWEGQNNNFRISVPFITDHPVLHSGLSDISVFDLMIFSESWGRWGIGPVALIPTGGSTRGAGQWAIGPVIGLVRQEKKFLWGVLNQNLFTYAGDDNRRPVNFSVLQPIFNYSLGNGWAIGSSDMSFTYNYPTQHWTSLPLGARISKVMRVNKRPIQLSLEYERNYAGGRGDTASAVRFNFVLFLHKPH